MPLPPWFPQRNPADQAMAVLKNFMYHTGVPVTDTSIEEAFKEYPDHSFHSLQVLGHLLQDWGIETLSVTIQLNDLPRLYYPAVAYLSAGEGSFVLLYQLTVDQILYIHPRLGWVQENLDAFALKWQGKVLLAIPTKGCGEPGYEQKKSEELAYKQVNPATNKVKHIPKFLSPTECDYLITLAAPLFTPSQVVNAISPDLHQGRSSYTAMLEKNNDTKLLTMYQRAAELLQLPIEHLEYGQCVSYTKGQEYQAHFDTVDKETPLGQSITERYGQRAVTMLIYLNDNFEGGETYFPTLDYKIKPQQGTAVVFHNLDVNEQVDPCALHAGLPVFSGRKYAFNLWGWNRPFRLLHS